jgi:hypothetical protein
MGRGKWSGIALAGLAVVPCVAAPAAAADRGDRVRAVTSDTYPVSIRIDERTQGLAAVARAGIRRRADGRAHAAATTRIGRARVASGAVHASSTFACVSNRRRDGFVTYEPVQVKADEDAYFSKYTFHLYKQNRARRLTAPTGRYSSKQFEMCAAGGADTRGGNRLTRAVAMFTLRTQYDRLIGWKWGSAQREGTVSASLSFAVPVKPVSIGATVNVNSKDGFKGAVGPDGQAPEDFEQFKFNEVNSIFETGTTWRWQGSTSFDGNVGHALWELPQSARNPRTDVATNVRWHCGHLFGIGCA